MQQQRYLNNYCYRRSIHSFKSFISMVRLFIDKAMQREAM